MNSDPKDPIAEDDALKQAALTEPSDDTLAPPDEVQAWMATLSLPEVGSLWRRTIAVFAFDGPPRLVGKLMGKLDGLGSESPEDEPVPWLATDISGGTHSPPYDAAKLRNAVDRVEAHAPVLAKLKVSVAISRGELRPYGALGGAIEEAVSLLSMARTGELLPSAEAANVLAQREVRRFSIDEALSSFVRGARDFIDSLTFTQRPIAGFARGSASADTPRIPLGSAERPLTTDDSIILSWNLPEQTFFYIIKQLDGHLSWVPAQTSHKQPGLKMRLKGQASKIAYHLLVSEAEISDLNDRLSAANLAAEGDPKMAAYTLIEGLGGEGDVALLTLDSPFAYQVTDDALETVIALAKRDKVAKALTALEGLDTGSFKRSDQLRAAVLRGTLQRRLSDPQATQTLEAVLAEEDIHNYPSTLGDAHRQLSRLRKKAGDLSGSRRHIDAALAAHRRAGDAASEAWDLSHKGFLAFHSGDLEQARLAYQQAHELSIGVEDPKLTAAVKVSLGQLYLEMGNLNEARRIFNEAEPHLSAADSPFNHAVAKAELASLEMEAENFPAAITHLKEQLHFLELAGVKSEVPVCLLNLANASLRQGDIHSARQWFDKTSALSSDQSTDSRLARLRALIGAELLLLEGQPRQARAYLEGINPQDTALMPEARWRAALAWAQLFEAEGANDEALQHYFMGIEAIESVHERLERQQRGLFFSMSRRLYDGWIAHLALIRKDALATLTAMDRFRARALLDAVTYKDPARGPAPTAATNAGAAPWRQALPDGGGLWVLHAVSDHLIGVWCDPTQEAPQLVVQSVARQTLAAAAARLKDACASPEPRPDAASLAKALAELLLPAAGPHLAALPEDASVCVCPPTALHGIPIHLLPEANGRPLAARLAISYGPSVALVAHARSVAFNAVGARVLSDPYGDLPDLRSAGEAVIAHIGDARRHYQGDAAHWSALVGDGTPISHLHIGCHAFAAAALELAPDDAATYTHIAPAWRHAIRSGRLPAALIAQHGPSARHVFLAACGSGEGPVNKTGDSPDLISWAFLSKGARAVISTLWQVRQVVCKDLIETYYQQFTAGTRADLALARAQRAQLAAQERGSAPATLDWAAFTLTGYGQLTFIP